MSIILPHPSRKRALLIIDIQPGFVKSENDPVVLNTVKLIQEGNYDFFVNANFYADEGSLWDSQSEWTFPVSDTVSEIKDILDSSKTLFITKTVKSIFNANKDLAVLLHERGIEEVHIVGYDINDCVLATANDAFDIGFYSYVIEEAADSSQNTELRDAALVILRENEMTNHSELIKEKNIL